MLTARMRRTKTVVPRDPRSAAMLVCLSLRARGDGQVTCMSPLRTEAALRRSEYLMSSTSRKATVLVTVSVFSPAEINISASYTADRAG